MKNGFILVAIIVLTSSMHAQTQRVAKPIVMTNYFLANSRESGNLAWFYPENSPMSAKQFEKVELGIELPSSIQKRVDAFFSKSRDNSEVINPFNRHELDIDVEFSVNGVVVKKVEGFYYEEYRRDLGNNKWIRDTTSYAFRIRYSPSEVGNYTAIITINGTTIPSTTFETTFTVLESDHKGFLEQGKNMKHFRFSKTKESFVGVGQVIPWVVYDDWYHTDVASGPVNFMVMYSTFGKMDKAGGNFTRMVAAPWFMQLEWEALGNYQPKLGQAWEFDRMNDKLTEYEIYYIFCALLHTPLESKPTEEGTLTPGISWEAYCYNQMDRTPAEVVACESLECKNPDDFYGSERAFDHQQDYFRYFVARWGYSTSLAGWQLMSETDQTCAYRDERLEDGTVIDNSANRLKVNKWAKNMVSFMKEECDDDHLKSISFITGKYYSSHLWDPDIFKDEEMHFLGMHDYVFDMDPPVKDIRNRNLIQRYNSINILGVGLDEVGGIGHPEFQDKMYINDEFGHAPVIPRAIPEDQNDDAVQAFNNCADFSFKQDLWFTFASGSAIAGLDWWNEHHRQRHAMWNRYFPGIRDFSASIDFENVDYTSVREARGEIYIAQRWPLRKKDIERSNQGEYRSSDKLEAYIQIDSAGNQGFGWMVNRSFHWANLVDSMECLQPLARGEEPFSKPYLLPSIHDDLVDSPITIVEDDAFIRIYLVQPRTTFTVDFYDTETNEIIESRTIKSSGAGTLRIFSPAMKPSERYDVAFKFYASDLGWK